MDDSLVLLRELGGDERRLLLLEMIREYGLERLVEASELEQARDAHAAYYLELAERAEPDLSGGKQVQRAEQLKQDYENIRATLGWLLNRGESEKALRLVTALQQFWLLQNYGREGRHFLALALEAAGGESGEQDASLSEVRARALYTAGYLAVLQNDPGRGLVLLEESERLCRQLQYKEGTARALCFMAVIRHNLGEVEKAAAMVEEALSLSREVGATHHVAEIFVLTGGRELVHGAFVRA